MMRSIGHGKVRAYAMAFILALCLLAGWLVYVRWGLREPTAGLAESPVPQPAATPKEIVLRMPDAPVPQPAATPKEIVLRMPDAVGNEFPAILESVSCYTSVQKPIRSSADFADLAPSQVLVSSPELVLLAQKLLTSGGKQRSCIGMRVLRPGESPYTFGPNSPIRLLITDGRNTQPSASNAGAPLRFEKQP
jgi:hypothetical protein